MTHDTTRRPVHTRDRAIDAVVGLRDDTPAQPREQEPVNSRLDERGISSDDVLIERVLNGAGQPLSTVATGGADDGLWRVRSRRHGVQLVIGRAEALSIARNLLTTSGRHVKALRPDAGAGHASASPGKANPTETQPPDRTLDRRSADERRQPPPERHSAPDASSREGHHHSRRAQSDRGQRNKR